MRVITTCEAINSIYTSLKYIVISENLTLLTELPHFGIVCQKLLFVLTLDTFKIRLDKFWQDQEVLYNWKADICTGSRSQVSVILD